MKYLVAFIVFLLCLYGIKQYAMGNTDKYLVFCVDVSASVDTDEYRLQRESYANILSDPEIQASLKGTHIALIEFSGYSELVFGFSTEYDKVSEFYREHYHKTSGSWTNPESCLQTAFIMLNSKIGTKIIAIETVRTLCQMFGNLN
jgi:hypothetical protein